MADAIVANDGQDAGPLYLHVAVLSDVGRARDHQEDACGHLRPSDPGLLSTRGELLLVADGMGGHRAGEVASATALAEIQRAYYAASGDDMVAALDRALQEANQTIFDLAQTGIDQQGMGSTVTAAAVRDREVHVASVGDSRAYLVREGAITQITEDHSWVGFQVRAGILAPEQAQAHPQRNVITRALGARPVLEPDLFQGSLQPNDVLVLCSDGLTVHVTDGEIKTAVAALPPEDAARSLVDLANQRGGSDNISVIIARLEPPSTPTSLPLRRLPVLLIGGLALILLLLILAIILLLKAT